MDLDEFLWRERLTNAELSRKTGNAATGISKIKMRDYSPNLFMAIKLLHIAKGEITPEELLSHKDYEEFLVWKKDLRRQEEREEKNEARKYKRKKRYDQKK